MDITIEDIEVPIAGLSYNGKVLGTDKLVAVLQDPVFSVDEEGVVGFEGAGRLIYQIKGAVEAQTLSISEDVSWNDIPDVLTDLLVDSFVEWRESNRLEYLERIGG